MNKKLIRLTESDLHNIVKESVNRVLKESGYEYGKTIRHRPNPNTPIPYDATEPILKVAKEFIDFRKNNPKLVQSLYDNDWFQDDGFENEIRNADEKLGTIFAEKMGYDYNYILPALKIAKRMDDGRGYDFNASRIWGY